MKAVRIHSYGNAEVLRYEEAPMPTLAPDDVLVRVVGASVNPVDWKIRAGYLQGFLNSTLPLILGLDVSGVVEAIGESVTRFKVGDSVFSRPDITRNGTYAEYVAIRESELAFKPQTVSHLEAASIPLAGTTAWVSLITTAQITAGQRVLIHAAAGGVGSLAVQLAKSRGAYVIGTASATNHDLVSSLGADEVIDYRAHPFQEVVKDVDVVLDSIGGQTETDSWKVLKPGGILVSIVGQPSAEKAQEAKVRGSGVFIQPDAEIFAQLAAMVDAGRLRPVIGAEFALKEIVKAHQLSESGRSRGKIVLYVGQP